MEIIALQEYTDKHISLYQGQIRNIEDNLANRLIENNIVKEHTEDESGGGGGSSVEVIELSYNYSTGEFSSPVTPTELVSKLESGTPIIVVKDGGFIWDIDSINLLTLPVGNFVELSSAWSTYEKNASGNISIQVDKFTGNLSNDTWNAKSTYLSVAAS